jgi:hypothetical protein
MKRFGAVAALSAGILCASLVSIPTVHAQSQAYKQLSGEWWQWALSIPAADNPLADATGANCMLGQRGADWFLAGTFGVTSATRTCSIPAESVLFFPVANLVAFDTPNACGQDSTPLPSGFYRAIAADFVNGVVNASATLDGQPVGSLQRVQSKVFSVAIPADNLFAAACAPYGGLPAGVYSPAVDDGIYARLNPLAVGSHTLHIHAENPASGFLTDVTYHLTVVPVVDK